MTNNINTVFAFILQSYGIKLGFGGIPGPSGGRDGAVSQGGGCCSWKWDEEEANVGSLI